MSRTIRVKRKGLVLELDYEAIGRLLNSDEMVNVLEDYAEQKAREAGPGYATDTFRNGKTRPNVSVFPETKEAEQDNYENNTLLKGIS